MPAGSAFWTPLRWEPGLLSHQCGRLEVGNGLIVAERRGRLKPDAFARFLALIKDVAVSLDQRSLVYTLETTLPLARKHGLVVYDVPSPGRGMYKSKPPFRTCTLCTNHELHTGNKKPGVTEFPLYRIPAQKSIPQCAGDAGDGDAQVIRTISPSSKSSWAAK